MANLSQVSGRSYPPAQLTSRIEELPKTESLQKIEQQTKASARKRIGKEAYEKAFKELETLLRGKDVSVGISRDETTGIEKMSFTMSDGKKIKDMPPDSVIETVRKAKQERVGWILDTFA